RIESLQLEAALLESNQLPDGAAAAIHHDASAFTAGGSRDLFSSGGVAAALGADVTFYAVPAALAPFYGAHPTSVHLFVRLRIKPGAMGPMWNMRMGQAPGR